ncbi:MAG: thioredoxin family protein [Thermoguttaceae bacterium]
MASVLDVTEQDFVDVVVKSDVPVLVDFWSPTCVPCRQIAPVLDSLAAANDGEYKFVKVNVYDAPRVGAQYGVDTLPTLLCFSEGRVVERMIGVQSQRRLQDVLDNLDV